MNRDRCARLPHCLLTALLAAPLIAGPGPSAGASPLSAQPAAAAVTTAADHTGTVVVQPDEPKFVAPTRRDHIGRIWAPVLIEGKGPFRLVLDTGANHSAITAATAAELGTGHPGPDIQVAGLTGTASVPSVTVDSMKVGDLTVGETSLRVLPNGLLAAEVMLGMVPTTAIIATGAERTVGNLALREAITRRLRVTHEDIMGVTLDVQKGDRLLTPRITLLRVSVDGVHVIYGDLYLFDYWKRTAKPTLVRGMDLLGSFDELIIDYKERKLLLSPTYQPCGNRLFDPFACS